MKKPNALLEDLKPLLPAIAARADQAERERSVPVENIALLKGIGLHKAFQPRHYGGLEISLPQFAECIAALAGACASTAWAMSLLCTHSHQLAMFSARLQDELWLDDPDATASSSIAPFGRTEEVEGGVLFSGEMGWSSGCDHAEWAIMGFRRGSQDYCFAVLPRSDYQIRDDWFAAGMRASGSRTLVVERAFVPEHRIQKARDMMEGQSAGFGLYPDSTLYFNPYRPYFASGFSTVSLGIAERMLEAFKDKTRNRVRAYTGAAVGAATPALMRLAESTHQVAAARALLEKSWAQIADYSARHQYPTRTELAFWRTNQGYAVKLCIQAVDRLMEAAGGGAWFDSSELQRLFRDAHMTGAHAYTDYDVCAQILGRELMGLEPDPAMT
ncbi:p-hydroxyphenylacetate 3-hydroxylase oxygenase component [Pseudomonas entomophila]|uniref:p-hydroxyphenylacetate 3-hydroxylase oxygenase component n=1 Tax=Pseudomonas entomophila TaxID=312306 RepID=UPI001F015326|nr:flavin-dependent monooxygenase [Pseudomonas entomophila]MCG8295189.1 flavin-dependent monooxygenase [Pseudomonas entomophila]